MTTERHTPHVFGAPLTAAEINAPLGELDAAIATVIATGSGASTTLTAQASAGQATLVVASSAGFAVGDPIYIGTGATFESRIIATVPGGGVTITVTVNLSNTYAVGKPVSKSPVEIVDARGTFTTLGGRLAAIEGLNVRNYGATGDGTTDDTTAINAAIAALIAAGGGVLYFPAGTYKTTAALTTISVPALIRGDGTTTNDDTTEVGVSLITSTSATAVMFDVTANVARFESIGLQCTAATPTAGAGIYVHGAIVGQRVDYENVRVRGFYDNIDHSVGAYWSMHDAYILDAVRYNLRIRNTINADSGDWSISDSAFGSNSRATAACIRIESSGGGKITNVKMNSGTTKYVHGIDLAVAAATATSILLISNCSFENCSGDAIHGTTSAGTSTWSHILINNCQFGLYGNNTGYAVSLVATTLTDFKDVTITDCTFVTDGTARAAIRLTNVNNVLLSDLVLDLNGLFNTYVLATTCLNLLGVWITFTPVWVKTAGTQPAIGNGTLTARYKGLDAHHYLFHLHFQPGSTTTFGDNTGTYTFSLPFTAVTGFGEQILTGLILDSGTDSILAIGRIAAGGNLIYQVVPEAGNAMTPQLPMVWANGDQLQLSGSVEI